MLAATSKLKSASVQFWVLAVWVIIVFLIGGSSRNDSQSLALLLPLSFFACMIALITIRPEHLARRKWLMACWFSVIFLYVLHLTPMPSNLWQSLSEQQIAADIGRAADLGEVWRPLTLSPLSGWHTLWFVATPVSVLLLGIQLNKEDLHRFLPLLLCLGGLSGFIGILQVLSDSEGIFYFYSITNKGAAVGLFSNRNHAATLLVSLFPMLAVYASNSSDTADRQRARYFVAIAFSIVLIPLILVTGSRSGVLMMLIALPVSALLYRKPSQDKLLRRSKVGMKFDAAHIAAIFGIISIILMTIFLSRAEALDRLFDGSAGEDARSDFWQVGLQMISQYLPLGSGIGSFVNVYQIEEPSIKINAFYVNHMHNDWLELALTLGLPGLLIFTSAAAFYLHRSVQLYRQRTKSRSVVQVALLGSVLIAFLALASVADYPLRTPSLMVLFVISSLWLTVPFNRSMPNQRSGQKVVPDKVSLN